MKRNFKFLVIALVAILVAGSAYAFAAENTIDASNAGYVASEVSGYAITNIVYDLDAENPSIVDAIKFDVAPISPGNAQAEFVSIQTGDSTWTECTLTTVLTVRTATCTYGTLDLIDVTELNVVASSSAE